jgi:hypothetical protein
VFVPTPGQYGAQRLSRLLCAAVHNNEELQGSPS